MSEGHVDPAGRIDLSEVTELMGEAKGLISRLHLQLVEPPGPQKSSAKARISKDLLRLGDVLSLASALAKDQYWRCRQ